MSFVVEMVDWLMGWPAGMKLNANLDKFLGEVFLWLVTIWSSKYLFSRVAPIYVFVCHRRDKRL